MPVLVAAGVFIVALTVYLLTLAPTVGLIDSGELTLAAWLPGIAHPPGFPIYILIGYLFSHLPLGSVAQRLNFMSALFAALAVAALFALAWTAGQSGQPQASPSGHKARRGGARRPPIAPDGASKRESLPRTLALIPAAVAALAWAFSRSLWSYSTVAEVYTLHLVLLVGSLAFLLHWRNANRDILRAPRSMPHALPSSYLAAFLYGLSLSDHHVTSLLLAPAIGILLLATAGRRVFTGRVALMAGLCLVALLPYVYLPLRAAQNPLLNWGNPQDATRLWWHLTAKWAAQYDPVKDLLALIRERFLSLWVVEFSLLGLPLAAVGVWSLWQRDRQLLAFITIAMGVSAGYGTIFGTTEPAAYFLTTFLFTAWLIGEGARGLLVMATTDGRPSSVVRRPSFVAGATFIAFAVPILALGFNYRLEDRSRLWIAYDYATNTLAGIAPNGVLFSPDWEAQVSPLLYVHHVEHQRPDVLVIDTQLLRRSWYYDYLKAQAPALMATAQPQVDAFLEQLDLFEHDRPYDTREIQTRFETMINTLVAQALAAGRPVYLAQDVDAGINPTEAQNRTIVAPDLQRVPQGLSFRLYADKDFHADPAPELSLRGLADGTVAADDLINTIRRRYAAMYTNRGLYLAEHNEHDGAAAAYQQAIRLEPSFIPAYQGLAKSLEALGRQAEADAIKAQVLDLAARQSQNGGP